jgi:hypothetical protein
VYGLLQLPSCLLLNTALADAGVGVWDLHSADVFMNSELVISHRGKSATAGNPVNRKIVNLLYLKRFAVPTLHTFEMGLVICIIF